MSTAVTVNETARKLEDFGLEILIEGNEILIPAIVDHVSVAYGDLQMKQGSYEITYINASKRLHIYDDNGNSLEIYLPKKATLGYYKGYFWIQF